MARLHSIYQGNADNSVKKDKKIYGYFELTDFTANFLKRDCFVFYLLLFIVVFKFRSYK